MLRNNLPLYIARRIYGKSEDKRMVSRPAIHIATAGVAVGIAVMLVTIAVVLGFKHTVSGKVAGIGSHIQVLNLMATAGDYASAPIGVSDSLMAELHDVDGVTCVAQYINIQGLLKTDSDFLGLVFKGIGQDYDLDFLRGCTVEGEIEPFDGESTMQQLLISKATADKLHLKVGDKVYSYFISDGSARMRKFSVSAIFATHLAHFDETVCFCDISLCRKISKWEVNQCSGIELRVDNIDDTEAVAEKVEEKVNRRQDEYGETMTTKTIHELYPQIFSWLELLDINVWIILGLMVCVAAFTMISGLLIIILERTPTVGLLKALGARDSVIRHTFIWFAVFIIGRGLIAGNLLGLGLIWAQQQFGLVTLDPETYYVSQAPVEFSLPLFALVNIATFLICVLSLLAPSLIVAGISPAKTMKYE